MLVNLIFLVLGAILGVAADRTWDLVARTSASRRAKTKGAERASKEARILGAIVDLYDREGHASSLYVPTHLPGGPIAMLGHSGIPSPGSAVVTKDFPLTVRTNGIEQMPVNRALIEARMRAGARLWDGDLLFLRSASVETQTGATALPALEAGVMNYYGFVSASAEWRAECERKGPHPMLETHYSSIDSLLRNPPIPLALSAAATCIFSTPDGPRVPLARRSSAVVNAMGHLCLAPTFGLEPSVVDHVASRFDVLEYNFLKEFLEEIYGIDALARNAESGLLDPDAIFDNPEAERLVAEFDSGRATLHVTGVGGELTDGSLTIALLAQFHSADFYTEVRRRARPSWEWQAQEDGHQRLRFFPLTSFTSDDGQELVQKMAHSSAFALDLALSVLRGPTETGLAAAEGD